MEWIEKFKELQERPVIIKEEILNKTKMKKSRFENIIYGRTKPTDLETWIIQDIAKKHKLV
jgi:hypothetical protein